MPTLPISRRQALACAGAILLALLVAGRFAAGSDAGPPPLAPVLEGDAAPIRELVVHVVGAVREPGLYRIAEGSRVADAVAKAGGSTPKADLSLINLAAPLADGLQVVVPRRAAPGTAAGGGAAVGPVHLNTATAEQLDALPGIGPVTALKIVEHRERNGAFTSVDDLDAVSGIGPARLEQLRELVAP